ncbi:MAG: anthranilate synthase component I family protein [Acidobacteriota bacterium]
MTSTGTGRWNLQESDLEALARRGDLAVLCREILADLLTPVAAFLHVGMTDPHAFLLESVQGGERVARYSFLGAGARRVFRVRRGQASVQLAGGIEQPVAAAPLEALRAFRRDRRVVPLPDLPRFTGGLVGFFSYDFVRNVEHLPDDSKDDLGIPDVVLGEYDTVLAFDHSNNRLLLMSAVDLDGTAAERQQAFAEARERLDTLSRRLRAPLPDGRVAGTGAGDGGQVEPAEEVFLEGVAGAQEAIRRGDIYQVVLSRRFSRPWAGAPLTLYRALRSLNPSPYHFFLACDGDHLAGASPEMLVRVEGRDVTLRPIAGTRPRGEGDVADAELERELLADEKERAEHVMLVDLARNDAGRVCRAGSVRVERFLSVERYSHVMHLVSTVRGELVDGQDSLDALAASFPAGTLSGAPKLRAMEIIDRTEPFRRGPYGGAVVYLDHGGDLDSCITIRTAVMTGGQVLVQAGAGIVADSDPRRELDEIDHKARAMMAALEQAAEGLP